MNYQHILEYFEIGSKEPGACFGPDQWQGDPSLPLEVFTPIDGRLLSTVQMANATHYEDTIKAAQQAFLQWRMVPAPKRGDIVRQIGEELRKVKDMLGSLVALEMGKIKAEGDGEVQEMVDMADFAAGLSRQLYGLTMQSERPQHRMYEQWHPLGVTGIISAFNFPVAVWAWNAFIAAICGNTCIWKPSLKTPLTAIAVQKICNRIMAANACSGVFNLLAGDNDTIAEPLVADPRVALLSFTGSTQVGRQVAAKVSLRLGKSLLELGGNNAVIIDQSADIALAVRAVLFGAVGTAGQRCTSTRRVLVHHSHADAFKNALVRAYAQLNIGNPLNPGVHMGPVVGKASVDKYFSVIEEAIAQGGQLISGGEMAQGVEGGFYVKPAIIAAGGVLSIMKQEHFVPVVFVIPFENIHEAVAINNDVSHGLSSAMFTDSLRSAEYFLSAAGSDCGIANINIGTSGAEIGGAFGGEKDTGGGRESGSDAWKAYMRRQTNTINWGVDLPLAQGIVFNL